MGNRRRMGTSRVQARVLIAALALLAAAGMILESSFPSRHLSGNADPVSSRGAAAQNPVGVALNHAHPSAAAKSHAAAQAVSLLAGLPMMFEPNQGQANLDASDRRAEFLARGAGYGLFLGPDGAILTLTTPDRPASKDASISSQRTSSQPSAQKPAAPAHVEALQMKLAGASPNATLTGADQLPSTSNYFIGNDRSHWRSSVPQFARVRYENVYPGINLVFYGNQGQLEYDFQVAPGADPGQAELEFDGARQLELSDGALVVKTATNSVRLEAPRVYQQVAGREEPVEGRFVLRAANRAGFVVGPYDRSRELIIDPVLTFATYFGGTGNELNSFIAIDGAGNIYITGSTTSPSLPDTTGFFQPNPAGAQNVYIAKINPIANPTQLVYTTYLGGSGPDTPVGISVDAVGDAYVAGTTQSGVGASTVLFPTSDTAYQNSPMTGSTGTQHVFVTELAANPVGTGALLYSSYLSGNGTDTASGMTIDAAGNIYVTGTTSSTNPGDPSSGTEFPASTPVSTGGGPFQPLPDAAPIQFFVTKVSTQAIKTGSIAYSTYFGGATFTAPLVAIGGNIAVDTSLNIYFTGTTNFSFTGTSSSTDFPIKNAYQPCLNTPPATVIVNPPTCSVSTSANTDAFVAKLTPSTTTSGTGQLQWSTYAGGTQNDSGTGIGLDSAGNVYITGTTDSPDFVPATTAVTFGAYQSCLNAYGSSPPNCPAATTNTDAFVARLSNPVSTSSTTNISLTYFTYLGGSGNELGNALTVDNSSGAVITGSTDSTDFPVAPSPNNDIQSTSGGGIDAFIARLNTSAVSGQSTVGTWATYFGGAGTDEGTGIALDVNQNAYFAGDTTSSGLATNLFTTLAGGSDAIIGQVSSAASLSITGVLSLGTNQTAIAAGNQATFTYTLFNGGPDLANNITITDDIRSTITQVPMTAIAASISSGTCGVPTAGSTLITCNLQSLQSGSTVTITIVLVPQANANSQTTAEAAFNGGNVTATATNNTTPASTSVPGLMSDFTLSVNPNNVTLQQAGDTARYQVVLTPVPVYSAGISLSVSGLPSASTPSFSTTPVTLAGSSPASPILSISTTARPIVTPTGSLKTKRLFYVAWLLPGLGIVGLCLGSRNRSRIAAMMLLCALFLTLLLPSCSHSTVTPPIAGTPAGTYNLTVTATSGSDTKSYPIILTVP